MAHPHPPSVVIVARHGPRLDAADQHWHLSTPTPYDPPLTYGGWNQCRALGQRIASLLHAREQSFNESTNEPPPPEDVKTHDFASANGASAGANGDGSKRKRKRKHKVVIHTSPFLRCLQTSVAMAAGMAQYNPEIEAKGKSASRPPSSMHSASPRMRGMDMGLPSIAEPRLDLAHEIARRTLNLQNGQNKKHRKSKLRVDAFLGEWLNPQYFDQITPPPPSNMMVAGAKGELIQNDTIDVYTPMVSTPMSTATSSLWGGGRSSTPSRENTMDDWSDIVEQLPPPQQGRRSRHNSLDSNDSSGGRSNSGRKSPFRPTITFQPLSQALEIPKQLEKEKEDNVPLSPYIPPTPTYAVSSSDQIPRGYMAHARNSCVSVDYQWDSSRPPQDWGNGGEYGEEWSALHKRFRRGLNHMIDWYSRHGADDRGEDALGFDQAEKHHEEEDEDLVVILITHGAGCNALIGALTGQPVLLDVGMASLTMAVRKDNAPVLKTPLATKPETNGFSHRRRGSLDMGLSDVYEMKLVSSSEHLRPGADPSKVPLLTTITQQSGLTRASPHPIPGYQRDRLSKSNSSGDKIHAAEPARSHTSSSLGSIRRPSTSSLGPMPPAPTVDRSSSAPYPAAAGGLTPPFSPGLWTPVGGRSPNLAAVQHKETAKQEAKESFPALDQSSGGRGSPDQDVAPDVSSSPPDSRPSTSGDTPAPDTKPAPAPAPDPAAAAMAALDRASAERRLAGTGQKRSSTEPRPQGADDITAALDSAIAMRKTSAGDFPVDVPTSLSRGLSQKGLWGSKPSGDRVTRTPGKESKRRWTLNQQDQ